MKAPPAREAAVPSTDMPPLVPAGTGRKFVMSLGGLFARMPTSDAHVSPAGEGFRQPIDPDKKEKTWARRQVLCSMHPPAQHA